MTTFTREEITIAGVKTVYLTAGSGAPLLFLHGGGTFHGFEFAKPWVRNFRVLLPYHPGFGESGDDPDLSSMQDYVMHYVELLDRLGLDRVNLVGFSLGGWLAASFATQHTRRINKLVLVAPAGLRIKEAPTVDLFRIPGEQVPEMLVHNFEVIKPHLPAGFDVDFAVDRYRETTTVARVAWERLHDPKLPRWLHRVTVPTMLVYGEQDRIVPAAQGPHWAKLIPGATVRTFPQAGHLVLDERPEAVEAVQRFLQ
ncbi:MAG TPA: alpha/beta hydrolase [Vineibacter sp.]|nr:alpha/beta hydrolase [Vineibacter sp.]